jgi:hypothetical protein
MSLKPPRSKVIMIVLFLFGLMSLSYMLGAAVIFFELPTSDFLHKAFVGAHAWYERKKASTPAPAPEQPTRTVGTIDKPEKTYDGYTLYMVVQPPNKNTASPNSQAVLINMRGDVVHRWSKPFSQVWSDPPHLRGPIEDFMACFFGCHLYGNGDLLVVYQGHGDPANGYGLVKLDKDSNVLWKYAANVHHDVDVAEDGTIYAVKQEMVYDSPKGLEFIPLPYMVDVLVSLSPEGVEQKKLPILEAIRDSPYSPLLSVLERPKKHVPSAADDARRRDVLHTNHIHVLTRKLAPKFPMFKAGQVLLSMRHLHAIAVMDPDTGAVVWAAQYPWRDQHDAQFLDNGRILIFDNVGSPKTSRVLELDPKTMGFPWWYPGRDNAPFISVTRGLSQRLPNGNTLIADSDGGEMFEVTPDREVVWARSCGGFIHMARRYGPDQLPFLKGGTGPRP